MERIEKLRKKALKPFFGYEFYYLFFKKYENCPELNKYERYSEAFYYAFSQLTPSISEGELIVGKRDIPFTAEQQAEWDNKYREIMEKCGFEAGGGQDSHMTVDYELLLNKGINGIIKAIDGYLRNCDSEKADFYKACRKCLEAVIVHSENYSRLALRLSEEALNPERRAELEKIAEICKKVPANPAETFYEAIQSVHFLTHCLSLDPMRGSQQFQLGRPDRYLLPYYENDIKNGELTKDYAQLLLDCLGIQINMRVPSGLSSGYIVGGSDESGNPVANELTDMCMQVIDDIRLVYPSVGLCYTEKTPEKYLEKACRLLLKGYSHPAVFNDDVIMQGLIHYGVPEVQAHEYIHSTCVEITPIAASNVWVASPYTNLPQLLLDIMNKEYSSPEELLKAYFERLDNSIRANFEEQNEMRKTRSENSVKPLLSCFVNDCLKRGTDIERGGAVYNWIMPSFVGMANLVDSFYAVKTLVFDEKRLTLTEFKAILDGNFEDNEDLRRYILNKLPKYGNNIDEIDDYFKLFANHIVSECEKYKGMHGNSRLIPSVFCWIMHAEFGRATSATPDGRKAGFPLGDGSGPCQGREKNGPTASVISSTKWEHKNFIGGVAVNLKFAKASLGIKSADTVKAVVKTYLQRGGFEVQINVIDDETLKKAKNNPEEYQDLVVRIGGYSDYFVRLTPEMQDELILRTSHNA